MTDAAAQYKKQDGTLSVSADGKIVSWRATGAGQAQLSITIGDITNLQQTPATSSKASIKVVVQDSAPQSGSYTLTFTSSNARDDQQRITGLLRKWIEASKSQNVPAATPAAEASSASGPSGSSAAMAMAHAVTANAKDKEEEYDDAKLLADFQLQRSLLNSNPTLRQRFDRALQDKPESVSIAQFSNHFWSTRVHMLRSHTIEKSQSTGTYNVLSVIKSKTVNGALTLSLTKEQIELLFRQHPVVQLAYNKNVPPLTESAFWERFFHSRLMKKLKGERILEKDVLDPKLDPYLTYDENNDESRDLLAASIPHFLDVEGNENNHSQKQGNRPDFTMNPKFYEKAPILRILNQMSEKMLKEVPPSDASRHDPAGLDEETYKELRLMDLQRADDDNRVILKVQDQSRFYSAGQSVHTSSSAATYTKRTPSQALSTLRQDLTKLGTTTKKSTGVDLHSAIAANDDSSSDEETSAPKKKHKIGSRSSRNAATTQVMSTVKKRHEHEDDYSLSKLVPLSDLAKKLGVSESTLDTLVMTHNTTVEFLHYFWAVFYSGDADRANEVAKLIESLDRSLDRIKAVATVAEKERESIVDRMKRSVDQANQQRPAAKRKRFDPASVKGGANAVNQVVEPLFRAINAARSQYQKALNEQLSAQSAAAIAT